MKPLAGKRPPDGLEVQGIAIPTKTKILNEANFLISATRELRK